MLPTHRPPTHPGEMLHAQIWLTLQAKWDLWHALRARGRRPKVKALEPNPLSVR